MLKEFTLNEEEIIKFNESPPLNLDKQAKQILI